MMGCVSSCHVSEKKCCSLFDKVCLIESRILLAQDVFWNGSWGRKVQSRGRACRQLGTFPQQNIPSRQHSRRPMYSLSTVCRATQRACVTDQVDSKPSVEILTGKVSLCGCSSARIYVDKYTAMMPQMYVCVRGLASAFHADAKLHCYLLPYISAR